MKGVVDDSGRAILPIKILCPKYPTGVQIDTWIDTGFTGDLVLPQIVIGIAGDSPRVFGHF
jgi:predicted aspartyl protease